MASPWMKFYPTDWRADPALRMCSVGARGLWIEMLCVMHEAEPRGSLLVNGKPVSDRQLAGLCGCSPDEIAALLAELEDAGVFSREEGVIFSRRMRRDDEKAERDKAHGRRGGNPRLKPENHGVNPPDMGEDKAQKPEARSQSPDIDASASIARAPAAESQKTKLKRRITAAYFRLANDPGRPSIDTGQIDVWEAQGYDLGLVEAVVMERLEARLRSGKPVRSLSYFADSVKEAHEKRAPPAPPKAEEPDWRAMMARFKGKGMWPSSAGPQPGYAGCRAPPDLLREFGYGAAA